MSRPQRTTITSTFSSRQSLSYASAVSRSTPTRASSSTHSSTTAAPAPTNSTPSSSCRCHIHLLLTTDNLPKAVKDIKGSVAHQLGKRVWQPGYTDHLIRGRADFDTHITYIHQNPVRARLVTSAADYAYSSAYRGE